MKLDWPRLEGPALPGRIYFDRYFVRGIGLHNGTIMLSNGCILDASMTDWARFCLVPEMPIDEMKRREGTFYFGLSDEQWPPSSIDTDALSAERGGRAPPETR